MVPLMVAKANSICPGPERFPDPLFDRIVDEVGKSHGIEVRVDEREACRFRLGRCACWKQFSLEGIWA